MQEFHRQLFNNSSDLLRREIKRITGVTVREAAAEIETKTGTVVHAFTSGTMVQVFLLADGLSTNTWNGKPLATSHDPRGFRVEELDPPARSDTRVDQLGSRVEFD